MSHCLKYLNSKKVLFYIMKGNTIILLIFIFYIIYNKVIYIIHRVYNLL